MAEVTADDLVDTKVITQPDDKDVVSDAKPDAKADVKPDDKPEAKIDAKPDAKPDAKADKVVDATWPADWREKAAGGDAKKLATLQRYASPQALSDALIAAQTKIRSGELKTALPKDPKPEELAKWRTENGIPEKPEAYDVKGIGLKEDKPVIDKFLAAAHGANLTNEQTRTALGAYYDIVEAAKVDRDEKDKTIQTQAEDELRAEWGSEFRRNMNLVTNLLDSGPKGLREKLLLGRLSDGTPIGSSPEALKFIVGLALKDNPSGVIAPSGMTTDTSVESRIAEIEKVMRTNRPEYNRNEKMQQEYRDLLTWREKNKSK